MTTAFSGQTVLVTGARGFIGSHLCRTLTEAGATVYALARGPRPAEAGPGQWLQGDLADLGSVRRLYASARPDTVFHLAGYVTGARELQHVLPAFSGNLLTTVNLLTVATDLGARRIVLAGSMEEPAEEGDPPSSPYAAAKWAAGGYARMFFALYQTPVVVARLFMTYGPGQEDRRKLIPYVTTTLLEGEAPRLSSGRREVDWIYVSDVVEGLLAVAAVPHLEGAAVDLGSGALVPIRTVVRKLVALVGAPVEPLFGALPERPLERVRAAERAATEARLGWKPVVDLDEGLRRTVEWYRSRRPAQAFGVATLSEGRREP